MTTLGSADNAILSLTPRLQHIEKLVTELHFLLIGRWQQTAMPLTRQVPSHGNDDVQGPLVTHSASAHEVAPSRSRKRRMRAARSKHRLWSASASKVAETSDALSEEKNVEPRKRTRTFPPAQGTKQSTSKDTVCNDTNFDSVLEALRSDDFAASMVACLTAGAVEEPCCAKCATLGELLNAGSRCVCDEFYCAECYKDAAVCSCARPCLFHWFCQLCGHKASTHVGDSCADETRDHLVCPVCEETCLELGFNAVATMDLCAECGRPDNQDNIQPCDGHPCKGAGSDLQFMAHTSCMSRVSHPAYREDGAYLCSACAESGVMPYDPSLDDDADDSDRTSSNAESKA
eukprot:TRINITY_DN45020_c0_g1_i1.p1 TRINITY_DN45020_c0_g1~~TRINITY_DN45020_c0_g1_i1.p1  ORF type:complete len:346 (-),score=26.97 TRINITY_DN45020_c0_g1_i1:289-1326(-)